MIRSLTARTILLFLLLDLFFSITAGIVYVQLMEVHTNLAKVIGLIVSLNVGRNALWVAYVIRAFTSVSRWEQLGRNTRSDKALRDADHALQTAPNRIALLHGVLFGLQYWAQTLWLLYVTPDWVVLSSQALPVTLAIGAALFCGMISFGLPLMRTTMPSSPSACITLP